jgi:hypothetical protein
MREVRACDFCGEGASGVYEPLSPALDDGPRMLLCDGCGETLSGVLDHLFDRLEDDGGVDASGSAAPSPPAAEPAPEPEPEPQPSAEPTPDPARSTAAESPSEVGGRPASQRKGTPRGYQKVMRFLEGREFPIDREEAEEMAAEAYDLDAEAVAAIVDHAKKHGRLREVRGELKR